MVYIIPVRKDATPYRKRFPLDQKTPRKQ